MRESHVKKGIRRALCCLERQAHLPFSSNPIFLLRRAPLRRVMPRLVAKEKEHHVVNNSAKARTGKRLLSYFQEDLSILQEACIRREHHGRNTTKDEAHHQKPEKAKEKCQFTCRPIRTIPVSQSMQFQHHSPTNRRHISPQGEPVDGEDLSLVWGLGIVARSVQDRAIDLVSVAVRRVLLLPVLVFNWFELLGARREVSIVRLVRAWIPSARLGWVSTRRKMCELLRVSLKCPNRSGDLQAEETDHVLRYRAEHRVVA